MKKISLAEWTNIAEIIAALAIVASLGYVGLEVRQNTRATEQSSYQNTNAMLIQGDLLLAADAELNRIVTQAETDPTLVTPEEWSRFTRYALPRLGMWEYLYLGRIDGSVGESQWLAMSPYFDSVICLAGYRRHWEENERVFSESFKAYVHGVIAGSCE